MTFKVTRDEIDIRAKLSELDKPAGVAGLAMLKAETLEEQFNLIKAGRRRLNINGCMSVWQRGTSMLMPQDSGQYLADRWLFRDSVDATTTYAQSTQVPEGQGFTKSLKISTSDTDTTIGSTQYSRLQYQMEGQDAQQFGYGTKYAKPVTVSFWVKAKVAGKYSISIEVQPGSQYRTCIKSYFIDNADEWEHKVVTFPPLTTHEVEVTNENMGWKVTMPLAVGSSWHDDANEGRWRTDGTYMMGLSGCANPFQLAGDIFFITGVQIEAGSAATPFEHRSYGEELQLCQRYFFKLTSGFQGNTDLGAPLSPTGDNGIMNFAVWDTTNCYGVIHFPIEMRTAPSIANDGSQSEANSFRLYSATATQNTSNFKFMNSSTNRCELVFMHSGFTVGDAGWVRLQNNAELWFDAEI